MSRIIVEGKMENCYMVSSTCLYTGDEFGRFDTEKKAKNELKNILLKHPDARLWHCNEVGNIVEIKTLEPLLVKQVKIYVSKEIEKKVSDYCKNNNVAVGDFVRDVVISLNNLPKDDENFTPSYLRTRLTIDEHKQWRKTIGYLKKGSLGMRGFFSKYFSNL